MKKIKHLYLHVPFCSSICNYCDFCHRVYDESLVDRWLKTLEKEIKANCKDDYETIYIGGGTPSCLSLVQLDKLLSFIDPFTNNCIEYTIEVNPESLTIDKIKLFKKYRINRISMGVQSSDNSILKQLNRKHTFLDVQNGISLLKENNLNNISIDLMYSLPNQTIEILENTLNDFLKLDVPHVSLYSLTVDPNTVFGKKNIQPLNIDIEADMYELIEKKLSENGYLHYEVSNFARTSYESKHNMGYWKYDDFLGLSLGASSKIDSLRYTNTFNFNEYFEDFNKRSEIVKLSKKDLMFENIMMSLRMSQGLKIEDFENKYDVDFRKYYEKTLNNPNIKEENGFLFCTNLEILNSVLLDFME